jgi:hypothetical protein
MAEGRTASLFLRDQHLNLALRNANSAGLGVCFRLFKNCSTLFRHYCSRTYALLFCGAVKCR